MIQPLQSPETIKGRGHLPIESVFKGERRGYLTTTLGVGSWFIPVLRIVQDVSSIGFKMSLTFK